MGEEILTEDDGYVKTLSINRPEKRNALNADALFSIGDIIEGLTNDNNTRVIVIRGAGEKMFSSGVDLSGGPELMERTIKGLERCLDNLIDYPFPIIAMIYGPAIGAGLDISVISDFRIASETARFGAPLVKLGKIYYYSAINRLTNLLGVSAAKELLMTGKLIDAKRAMEIGLVNRVVPAAQLKEAVYFMARELAEETAPLSVKATKFTINKLLEYQNLNIETEAQLKALADEVNKSEDGKEGVNAMLEKRKPKFLGK